LGEGCQPTDQPSDASSLKHICIFCLISTLICSTLSDLQTCAELEDLKKSHALEVEELNVVMQLLEKDRDRLQQEVCVKIKINCAPCPEKKYSKPIVFAKL